MPLVIFLGLFFCLFLFSRVLTSTLSLFFLHATKSHGFAIQLLALLFLPGVIVHELSHWLAASLLFVPTGDIEFFPQAQGNSVKLGSVQIAITDPIRRFIIGIAPIIFGLLVLLGIFWYLSPSVLPVTWKTIVFFYCVFEIGNTMFSSRKDLEGVIGFFILVFLFISLLFFLKISVLSLVENLVFAQLSQSLLQIFSIFFFVAIGIDGIIAGFFGFLMKVFKR